MNICFFPFYIDSKSHHFKIMNFFKKNHEFFFQKITTFFKKSRIFTKTRDFQNHAISKITLFQNHAISKITLFSKSRDFKITLFQKSRYFQNHAIFTIPYYF